MYAEFHREKAPIIRIEFTGEKANAENFAEYLQGLKDNYAQQQTIALVFDARRALDLNPLYQLKQAQWLRQNKSLIEKYCRGVAYIIPNDFLRNILVLIFKIQPNPVPFKVFGTLKAGMAWADEQLNRQA